MCKVLIVEDDAVNMFLYRKMLESEGYDVLMSSTGSDAIDIAKKYGPDMVLLDIFLPGKNGFEIYKEMKGDKKLSDLPVIFASASFDNDTVVNKTGIDRKYVMSKPINFQNLINLIRQIQNSITPKIPSYA